MSPTQVALWVAVGVGALFLFLLAVGVAAKNDWMQLGAVVAVCALIVNLLVAVALIGAPNWEKECNNDIQGHYLRKNTTVVVDDVRVVLKEGVCGVQVEAR